MYNYHIYYIKIKKEKGNNKRKLWNITLYFIFLFSIYFVKNYIFCVKKSIYTI